MRLVAKLFYEALVLLFVDPPGRPNITGLTADSVLEEGQLRRLTCMSMAGNPLADLTWFRGDEKIEGTTTDKTGDKLAKSDGNERSAGRTKKGIQCRVSSRPFIMCGG